MKNLFLVISLMALALLLPAIVSAEGNISVSSSPTGAEIYLNGISTSLFTPAVVENVPAGTNNITLVLSGYVASVWPSTTVTDNVTTVLSVGTLSPLTGSVSFESYPAGAQVYVDNVYIGYSNISSYPVAYGSRTVLMQLAGYRDQTQNIVVDRSSQTVTTAFASPVVNGSVYFTTSPSYAEIYLDSVYTGTTPLTVYNVTPGSYSVMYYRSGYTNWSASFTVTAGVEPDVYAALTAIVPTTTTSVTTATTSPTAAPVAAITTAAITTRATTRPKATQTVPKPWPTSTTPESPVEPALILGAVGLGIFAVRRR